MGVTVVGSVNLDLVAAVPRLPKPGETLTATGLTRIPGAKAPIRRWPLAGWGYLSG